MTGQNLQGMMGQSGMGRKATPMEADAYKRMVERDELQKAVAADCVKAEEPPRAVLSAIQRAEEASRHLESALGRLAIRLAPLMDSPVGSFNEPGQSASGVGPLARRVLELSDYLGALVVGVEATIDRLEV